MNNMEHVPEEPSVQEVPVTPEMPSIPGPIVDQTPTPDGVEDVPETPEHSTDTIDSDPPDAWRPKNFH